MADLDFDDEDFDYDEADLSPQMRAQLDRLILHNKGLGHGGRTRSHKPGAVRRHIEDWHDSRAVQRSVDYLSDNLDYE